jgi:cytochrome b subunit of formate dehydrogenase
VLYLLTFLLLFSGAAVFGEGNRTLEGVLGGHVAAARWHRWLGYALLAAGGLVLLLRPRACARFVVESVRFRRSELGWFGSYPAFLFRPFRNRPARHEGHFDPGQRLFNLLVLLSLIALSSTGVLMSFPRAFVPAVFAWSLRAHRAATWALAAGVTGHVVVASGILPGYRGTWRAMHGRGRVPQELAERLWPRWEEEERGVGRSSASNPQA